jgi:drug/metabolite transporter (DMT)-like permease
MAITGSAVTVSEQLTDYPLYSAQAVRYGVAALLLVAGARLAHRVVPWPTVRETGRLFLLAAMGLSLFNIAVVRAVGHAEPAVVGVIVAGVPVLLALGSPLVERRRPPLGVVAAAGIVVVGAILVEGGGRSDGVGIAWAVVAMISEAAFTLLALPVLPRLGPLGVSVHTCWLAALQLAVLAVVIDGSANLTMPDGGVVFAVLYLAVVLTAIAFLWWFEAVRLLGGEVAGLYAGVVPIAAAASGLLNGTTTVEIRVLGGTVLAAAGIVAGMRAARGTPAVGTLDRP